MSPPDRVCGWSRGLGRGGSRTRGGELGRGPITQRTVWSLGVVFVLPSGSKRPGGLDTLEDLHRQELVAESPVEALGVAFLPGAPRLDVERANAHQLQPVPEALSDKFGPVVAANVPGHTTHREQFGERVDHILARDASVHLQAQALAGVLVHDRQPLQLATAGRPVEHEVPAPHVVGRLGPSPKASIGTRSQTTPFSLLYRHFQPLPLPQSKYSRQPSTPSFFSK